MMWRDLWQDLRHGARTLHRGPGFAALVVGILAVGLGANAALFRVVNAVLLRPLPVHAPDRLVLFSSGLESGRVETPARGRVDLYSYALFQRLRAESPGMEDLAAQDSGRTSAMVRRQESADDGASNHALRRWVSANYFTVLGAQPFRGRFFGPQDGDAQANPVVVLSHGYWRRRFGSDPSIVGGRVTVNGRPHTVVGVAAPGFQGLDLGTLIDLWVPLDVMAHDFLSDRALLERRDLRWLQLVGRSRPGQSLAAAETAANLTLQRFLADNPPPSGQEIGQPPRIILEPGARGASALREQLRAPLLALMVSVGLLLLIVCLNVGHLLLARAAARRRELSIRAALGASRARIVRHLLAEALLLSLLGAAAGSQIARWVGAALVSMATSRQPWYMQPAVDVGADLRVLLFTAAMTALTAAILGLVPAWQVIRLDTQQTLRSTSMAIAAGGSRRLATRLLLSGQVALSIVLLVGAGLLAGSLRKLRSTDTGFDQEHVLNMYVSTEFSGLDPTGARQLQDDLLRRVSAIPGVSQASLSFGAEVLQGGIDRSITVTGTQASGRAVIGAVTPGYFDTHGMALRRGRAFTSGDHGAARRVAIVNEALTRLLFPGGDAVGRHLTVPSSFEPSAVAADVEIVGVVKDARVLALREAPAPMVYLPAAQTPVFMASLAVRTAGDPARLGEAVARVVREAHPSLPVRNVRTLRMQMERALSGERFAATLASAFGLAALLLASLGLYGVVAQWAAQRTREIGLRMAIGATGLAVRWLVLRQALLLVLAGTLAGVPAAIAGARLLQSMLFGVAPLDPATLGAAVGLMLLVALLAAYLPAHRASRVHPMAALRGD